MKQERTFSSVLTFNLASQVFVSDSRVNVYIDIDTWVLVLYKVNPADEAKYECHVNADPPQKVAINLFVKGTLIFLFCSF